MQEPVIFNYTILENILYSKLDATNDEVLAAATTANAMEFISANDIHSIDDKAESLIKEMESHKDAIINLIGKAKYDEELEVLAKIDE
jgi:ABC-type multidrug transport system fused ATPase/permease subunit